MFSNKLVESVVCYDIQNIIAVQVVVQGGIYAAYTRDVRRRVVIINCSSIVLSKISCVDFAWFPPVIVAHYD